MQILIHVITLIHHPQVQIDSLQETNILLTKNLNQENCVFKLYLCALLFCQIFDLVFDAFVKLFLKNLIKPLVQLSPISLENIHQCPPLIGCLQTREKPATMNVLSESVFCKKLRLTGFKRYLLNGSEKTLISFVEAMEKLHLYLSKIT